MKLQKEVDAVSKYNDDGFGIRKKRTSWKKKKKKKKKKKEEKKKRRNKLYNFRLVCLYLGK